MLVTLRNLRRMPINSNYAIFKEGILVNGVNRDSEVVLSDKSVKFMKYIVSMYNGCQMVPMNKVTLPKELK